MVTLPGHVIAGGVTSLTVTVNVQPLVLPLASVTSQVTSVAPRFRNLPARVLVPVPDVAPLNIYDFCAPGIGVVGQLSVACTSNSVPDTTYPQVGVTVAFLVVVDGQEVIVGFSLSFTVTVKVQLAELFDASTTFQVIVVTPLLKTVPLKVLPVAGVAPAPLEV